MTDMADSERGTTQSARIASIESDVSGLKQDLVGLKTDFQMLGGQVVELSKDINASGVKQDQMHADTIRRQESFQKEWRDAKEAERREHDQRIQSRAIGPLQAVQIAAAAAGFFALVMGGFFFLVKAYLDGSTTPAITQLSERQNATTEANGRRNELMDAFRADLTKMTGTVADLARTTANNQDAITQFREVAAKSADDRARLDERIKAQREAMQMLFDAEAAARKTGDDALRDELRQFKARATP